MTLTLTDIEISSYENTQEHVIVGVTNTTACKIMFFYSFQYLRINSPGMTITQTAP